MNNNQPSTITNNMMRVHLVLMASPILLAVVLVVTSLAPAPSLIDGSSTITERLHRPSAIPPGSNVYDFDLATKKKGALVEDVKDEKWSTKRYARRIETTAKVEFTTAIIELEQQTTELITTAASDITSDPLAIEFFHSQGMKLDNPRSFWEYNVYVAEYTPVVNGQPSDITQYRLFTYVDVSPQHLQMQQAWRDSHILQRLIKFCAIAGTTVLTLLVYRGNQIMIVRKTSPTKRLLFIITAWATSFSAVAFLAANYF